MNVFLVSVQFPEGAKTWYYCPVVPLAVSCPACRDWTSTSHTEISDVSRSFFCHSESVGDKKVGFVNITAHSASLALILPILTLKLLRLLFTLPEISLARQPTKLLKVLLQYLPQFLGFMFLIKNLRAITGLYKDELLQKIVFFIYILLPFFKSMMSDRSLFTWHNVDGQPLLYII